MIGKKFFLNARDGVFQEKPEQGKQTTSFNDITGHLVNVAFKNTAHGDTIRLYIVNELNFYVVSMFLRTRQANAFMLLARNLDVHIEMTFRMQRKFKESGYKDFFSINQNGGPVRWSFTKENQHELPTAPEDRRALLRKIIEDELIPRLQKKMNPYPNHMFYVPAGSGLRGGYFDEFKSPEKSYNNSDNDAAMNQGSYTGSFNKNRHFPG